MPNGTVNVDQPSRSTLGKISEFDWGRLMAESWGRKPALFKNAFAGPIWELQIFFDMLLELRSAVERGKPANVIFFDQSGSAIFGGITSQRLKSSLETLLPTSEEPDLKTYLDRLTRDPKYAEFGIFVESAHEFVPIWRPISKILDQIYHYIDLPRVPLNTDVWIGNYKQTPIGAHKDPLDNMMLMVSGTKRIRLWDDPFWREMVDVEHDRQPFRDYGALISQSITFELEAGDLLYWPASYWHVGEGGSDYSVSINIDFMSPVRDYRIHPLARKALDALLENAAGLLGDAPPDSPPSTTRARPAMSRAVAQNIPTEVVKSVEAIKQVLANEDDLYLILQTQWLERCSAYGFNTAPPALPRRKLSVEEEVTADPNFPILWTIVGERLVFACCGKSKVVPLTSVLPNILELVSSGQPTSISSIIAVCQMLGDPANGEARPPAPEIVLETLEALVSMRGLKVNIG
jgi:50S ribosomal protein L16 3-hydroxylase